MRLSNGWPDGWRGALLGSGLVTLLLLGGVLNVIAYLVIRPGGS